MNILILTNHLKIGGITRYVLNLSYGLKYHGHKVFVGAMPGWGESYLNKNKITYFNLHLNTKSILSPCVIQSYFSLRKFIRRENINLVHAQTRITQFLGFLLSKTLKVSYVSTFHGFYRPHFMRRIIPCLGDLTIAVSQSVGAHLIDDFYLKREHLRVIYNSVNPEIVFDQDRDYSNFKGSPTLGIIARLSEEKGHYLLFSVFKQLIKDYPDIRLLVVGSGKKELELKDWVARHNFTKQIIFLGNISNLNSVFRVIDVSVLPSTKEGLGFSVIEAQVNGVPVVASRVGGIKEIIQDGQTGLLFESGDSAGLYRSIKALLSNPLLRQKIIDSARIYIKETFSLENMVLKVESVYNELLNTKR